MKKFLLATVAVVALGATVPALAADLGAAPRYTKAPAYVAPIYNWTGFYIGGHLGGGFAGDNNFASWQLTTAVSSAACRAAPTTSSRRTGSRVSKPSTAGPATTIAACCSRAARRDTNNQRSLGSVTGRLGYAFGPALLYAKGGYALKHAISRLTPPAAPVAFTTSGNHRDGYTVGAGLEYMFAPNWSAKLEYHVL